MNKQKVVFITGASSGIGEATAKLLAEKGHKVVVTARSEDKLEKLVQEIGSDKAFAVAADATDFNTLQGAVNAGVKKFGRIDAVFANAGMGVSQAGTEQGNVDEWDKMIAINVNALTYTAKASLPELKKTKGHFIITSSIAGKIALKGSIYGATKWFAYGFGKNLAEEMKEWEGRCTTICPGMVNTPFFDEAKPDKLDPSDIAEAVLYAISAHERCDVREICLMPTK